MKGAAMNNMIFVVALAVGAPALKEAPKRDASVVGEWDVESVSTNGNPGGGTKGLRYTFTPDGNWLIHRDGQELQIAGGTRAFTQDGKSSPPAIDLVTSRGAAGESRLIGIYKLEGATLTICGTRTKDAERPKTFEPGAGITIYTLKRAKKE
jgi:uncharacterized protein (TIGR03067 family)